MHEGEQQADEAADQSTVETDDLQIGPHTCLDLRDERRRVEGVEVLAHGQDTIQQCPSLIGAEIDFLEASEQFAALKHGAPHRRRKEIFGLRRGNLV